MTLSMTKNLYRKLHNGVVVERCSNLFVTYPAVVLISTVFSSLLLSAQRGEARDAAARRKKTDEPTPDVKRER